MEREKGVRDKMFSNMAAIWDWSDKQYKRWGAGAKNILLKQILQNLGGSEKEREREREESGRRKKKGKRNGKKTKGEGEKTNNPESPSFYCNLFFSLLFPLLLSLQLLHYCPIRVFIYKVECKGMGERDRRIWKDFPAARHFWK